MQWRQLLLVVLLVVAVVLIFFYWKVFFVKEKVMSGEEFIEYYEDLMRSDTYGGKTPEETLGFFVEALRKENADLASKYFRLDDDGGRSKWESYLNEVKKKGLLKQMADDIDKYAKPDLENIINENDFKYVLRMEDGLVGADINMEFNEFSGVWKIESL